MTDLIKGVLNKFKDRHEKNTEFLKSLGDTSISFSNGLIESWIESGQLPQELANWYSKYINELYKQHKSIEEYKEKNPTMTQLEVINHFHKTGDLSPEESAKIYEDGFLQGEFMVFILQNRDLLESNNLITKEQKTIFNEIEVSKDFTIVRAVSDVIYHLKKILDNMELKNLYDNVYIAKGSVENTKGESVSLEYNFIATSKESADEVFENYKQLMVKKGLKVWTAYWCSANLRGRVEYKCSLNEVMDWTKDEDRSSYLNQEEKQEFWGITKMLEKTKLTRSKLVKRGKRKVVEQWIEQPLVQISGGERLPENGEKHPDLITVRVLMPLLGKKGAATALYRLAMMKLHPTDFLLSFIIQTRASQMGRGHRELSFDWDYLFEIGNLEQTAVSNTRMAKAKIRQKMDKLKQGEIIEDFDEILIGMNVKPKKQVKKQNVK